MGRNFSGDGGGGGGGKIIRTDIITATGNYIKPDDIRDTDLVLVDIWGAGTSGVKAATGGAAAQGGIPGCWVGLRLPALYLPEVIPVVVGAGGPGATSASPQVIGGDTWFGGAVAAGGFGENTAVNQTRLRSYYWYAYSSNTTQLVSEFNAITAFIYGKELYAPPSQAVTTDTLAPEFGRPALTASVKPTTMRGGFGGASNGTTAFPGQISFNAGSGGAGAISAPASDGETPAGGGGGCASANTAHKSGSGGNGEIRVRYLRGASL